MNGRTARKGRRSLRRSIGLLFALSAMSGCFGRSPEARPNIVLIVLDTTRADHLSIYGYKRDTTPHLAAFAEEAIRFERAYATSTWTVASHASLFTGLLPVTHQATQENLRLDQELDTLAELLSRAGYETVAFTNNSWISAVTELSQGFEKVYALWRDRQRPEGDGLPHPTNRAVSEWLRARLPDRPFFLFINYMEPHWPYKAPLMYQKRYIDPGTSPKVVERSGFPAIFWYLRNRHAPEEVLRTRSGLYDAELAYLDATLGELLDSWRELALLDEALVVVTSDHGENLGEHGHQGHSFALYDSTLRIPLLIRQPGGKAGGTLRQDPVQLTDVFTTIASAAGIETLDERVVGEDLLSAPLPEDRPIIGEYYHPKTFLARFPRTPAAEKALAPFKRRIRSIQIGPDKLIWGSDGRHELYQTREDPGEADNRIERTPERARRLETRLAEIVERLSRPITKPQPSFSEMDPETIENLRALGYLP